MRGAELGASLTEFAIAFPLFVVLMLVVVDLGANQGDQAETAYAAQEAASAGVSGSVGRDAACALYVDESVPTATRRLFCLAKERTHRDERDVRVKAVRVGSGLLVCVESTSESVTGLFSWAFRGSVHQSRAFEAALTPAAQASIPAAAEEAPLAGHGWRFCTLDPPPAGDSAT